MKGTIEFDALCTCNHFESRHESGRYTRCTERFCPCSKFVPAPAKVVMRGKLINVTLAVSHS